MELYKQFSNYLKDRYGEKVYKIPLNIQVTCPNRDGLLGCSGCIFCGEEGAGFENLDNYLSVREQLQRNIEYIGKNYNSKKFIAYFQNFSNTYIELSKFKQYIKECIREDIVAIYISTRPDTINDKYLEFLKLIKEKYNIDIVIELGLQTINIKTLNFLNRGHGLAEFVDASLRIKKSNLEVCVHMIIDIPNDDIEDIIEAAKIISALGIEQVKCHSLYILDKTKLGELYKKNLFKPINKEDYIERMITFLEYLNPQIVIQRLLGRAPKEKTLFCNWNTSWWKIKEEIEKKMISDRRYQGGKFNYLNGTNVLRNKINE